jgi:hypothetical protein
MKDVAQIVQTEDDKPQNIDNIITEFSNIMVKTAEQLCPKRKCKKKRKGDWTPDMTVIVKKGKFYHWKCHWIIKSCIIYFQDWCIYSSHTPLSVYQCK